MRHALLFAFVVGSVTIAGLPAARAQSDAALGEAQARFKEGLALVDRGEHEAARLKFQQAWAVFRSPAVLYNLARAEQLTGHDIEAFEHFREFLKTGPDPKVTSAHREKAEENLAALAGNLGLIEVDAPPTARITVDGRIVQDAVREPVPVRPGRHVVEATFDGRIESITVECKAGTTTKAKMDLDAPHRQTEGATVEPPPPVAERSSGSSARIIVPAAIGVAALAALGVGIGFGVASQSAKDEEDERRQPGVCVDTGAPECRALDETRADVSTKGAIATAGYVSGGVLLAAAAITYAIWPAAKRTGSRLTVSPTASGGMVRLGGTF